MTVKRVISLKEEIFREDCQNLVTQLNQFVQQDKSSINMHNQNHHFLKIISVNGTKM